MATHDPSSSIALTFFGGAGTVTGSKTLVEVGERPREALRALVDCGLFQGFKHLRLKNRAALPIDAASIGTVLLTHAHIDHCGWLPVLVKHGYAGDVLCTAGTRDLATILLRDAARLETEQAEWLRKKRKSKHARPEPLFTVDDAEAAIARLRAVAPSVPVVIDGGAAVGAGAEERAEGRVRVRFTPAGHIIGASSVHIESASSSVLFSGDVGRGADVLMRAPALPPPAATLVLEATYGARTHPQQSPRDVLAQILRRTIERRGIVMVPAFAVGRAQALLHLVRTLIDDGAIPRVPVFLNSPMAAAVTDVTKTHAGELRISERECRALDEIAERVITTEESKALNLRRGPMIVVAGSGMMTGGRILHHLAAWGGDARNTLLLTGYQAPGTRGAALLAGASALRLFGEDVPMRCELARFDLLSGHADADELLAWVRSFPWRPRQVLLNHAEPDAADALRLRLERELGLHAQVVLERDRFVVGSLA